MDICFDRCSRNGGAAGDGGRRAAICKVYDAAAGAGAGEKTVTMRTFQVPYRDWSDLSEFDKMYVYVLLGGAACVFGFILLLVLVELFDELFFKEKKKKRKVRGIR